MCIDVRIVNISQFFFKEVLFMRYDIKITRIKDESSNLLGYADVSLGGAFAIKGIKIMNGSNGPFVSMPNYKSKK